MPEEWEPGEEEERGIPGHAGRGAAAELQRSLKNLGCRFEAEGDMVRIHLGSAVVELKDEPARGAVIEAVIPLLDEAPYRDSDIEEAVGDAAKAYRILYKAAKGLKIEYELDTSLPGYPMLRARFFPESYRAAAERLLDAVMSEGCS